MSEEQSNDETADIPSDYDELVNVLLPVATEQLEESGHFSPVAAFVQKDGTVCNLAVEFDDGEPDPSEVIEALEEGLREQVVKGVARSSAICSVVIAQLEGDEPNDAIAVTLEREDGDPLNVFLPYSIDDGAYDFGELVAGHGTSTIFSADA